MCYSTFKYNPVTDEWWGAYKFKDYPVYENYSLQKVTFKLPFAPNKNKQIKFN